MAVTQKTDTAKLPFGWDAEKEALQTREENVTVDQISALEDLISVFDGNEADMVDFVNSALWRRGVSKEYQSRAASYRPSDKLSDSQKDDRAVNALVRTGLYTIDEARKLVAEKRSQ